MVKEVVSCKKKSDVSAHSLYVSDHMIWGELCVPQTGSCLWSQGLDLRLKVKDCLLWKGMWKLC